MPSQRSYARLLLFVSIVSAAATGFAQNPVYILTAKPQRAKVTIMALSSAVRQGSGNQEIYLAEVRLKEGPPQLAKLMDTYSASGEPIRRALLRERPLLRMTLTRNPDCDAPGRAFFLDGNEANVFDAATRATLRDHAAEPIRCFIVAHEATRLSK